MSRSGKCIPGTKQQQQQQLQRGTVYVPDAWRAQTARAAIEVSFEIYIYIVTELFNPFRTAVPFWGQTSQILSNLSPKRD